MLDYRKVPIQPFLWPYVIAVGCARVSGSSGSVNNRIFMPDKEQDDLSDLLRILGKEMELRS
jgi:hypothetical protein